MMEDVKAAYERRCSDDGLSTTDVEALQATALAEAVNVTRPTPYSRQMSRIVLDPKKRRMSMRRMSDDDEASAEFSARRMSLTQRHQGDVNRMVALEDEGGLYKHPHSIFKLTFKDPALERAFRDDYDYEKTTLFRRWCYIIILFHVVTFVARDVFEYDKETLRTTLLYARVPSLCIMIAGLFVSRLPEWENGRINQQWFLSLVLLAQSVCMGLVIFTTLEEENEDDKIGLPNSMVACVIVGYTAFGLRMKYACITGWGILLIANAMFTFSIGQLHWAELSWRALVFNVPLTAFNVIGMVTAYQIEHANRESFRTIRKFMVESAVAQYEQQRGEFFLRNILPQRIVRRLGAQPTIAQRAPSATVMFLCVENLIELTSSMPSRESVSFMNTLFEICDRRAEQFRVEKVKTIVDKYMCVSGALDEQPDHAIAMADMALAAMADLAALPHQLKLRAGLSSGPIVHGVIGLRTFCWDIWGDTVNTASRMESAKGSKNKVYGVICVSEFSEPLLRDTHDLDPAGELDVKGKGKLRTYFLRARKSPEAAAAAAAAAAAPATDVEAEAGANASTAAVASVPFADVVGAATLRTTESAGGSDERKHARHAEPHVSPSASPEPHRKPRADSLDSSSGGGGLLAALASPSRGGSKVELVRRESNASVASGAALGSGKVPPTLARQSSVANLPNVMPTLDVESYIKGLSFQPPQWRELSADDHHSFYAFRHKQHVDGAPAMVTSLFIALLVYCVMVVADVLLVRVIGDVPSGVLVARFLVVVPLWLTHYPLSQRCSAFYRESYSLVSLFALFCVLVMTGAASYIQRQIERDPIPGAQFYAPLPVAYAMYLCYVVFGMSTYWVTATAVAIGAGLFAEGWIAEPISQEFVYFAFWGFGFLVFGVYMSYNIELLALTLWHATVGVQRDKRVIDNKREQADALLKNIVPEVLIPDLTHALTEGSDLSALAKNHQQVCILFSDVAGFTAMSEKMDPFKLVNWLNALFQIFDKLADKYHVNKLKTIGDAYVACGGLLPFVKEPPPIAANGSAPAGRGSASALGVQSSSSRHQPQQLQQQQRRSSRASEGGEQEEEKQQSLVLQREHTNDVVNMALQVLEKVATLNESGKTRQPVSLRIGVHTGPLLAGIIGRRKFQYDIFGHSVHVAEEMESSGQVGRVHISTAAYRALVRRDTLYVFDEGPGIELEGGTREPTWFVMENKGRSRRDKVSRLMGSIIDTATSIRRGDDDEA